MREYLSIGCTPYDESCLQVGHSEGKHQRVECLVFLHQIQRHYPIPTGCNLTIKSNSHDFGTYYEVNCSYEDGSEEQLNWALDIEGDNLGVLQNWDKEALQEIDELIKEGRLPEDYKEIVK